MKKHSSGTKKDFSDSSVTKEHSVTVPVRGMTCASCVRRVENAISQIDGVSSVSVNLATEEAHLQLLSDPELLRKISSGIAEAGYDLGKSKVEIPIQGMTCASCVTRVQKAIESVPGVISASVNLATESASVQFIENATESEAIYQAIRESGYEPVEKPISAEATDAADAEHDASHRYLVKQLRISAGFTLIILLLAFHPFVFGKSFLPQEISHYLQFVLVLPVMFYSGRRFYILAWKALKHRTSDMNTLVSVGTLAAFLYSSAATFYPSFIRQISSEVHVYFDTAAVIITLILFGKMLESRAKGRASEAIKRLLSLGAKSAVLYQDGKEVNVPVEKVQPGDILVVRPGDRIPADGEIIYGEGSIDKSMLTGESIPVDSSVGTEVMGGTLNLSGYFRMKALKVGKDTALSRIIQIVKEAQTSKAPSQRLADKIAGIFVPIVIAIAILTFFIWLFAGPNPSLVYALLNFISVMIIACPCALGLAIPAAIMVGTGRGAELGVLIRNGETLERARKLTTVAFDKTGTLTQGKLTVTDVISLNDYSRDELLFFAASAEKGSEHPLARAIFSYAEQSGLSPTEPKEFKTKTGFGISAKIKGTDVTIGKPEMFDSLPETAGDETNRLNSQGKTSVIISIDGKVEGIIAFSDLIKPEAADIINYLRKRNINVVLLTGDNERTAAQLAEKLDIDRYFSGILPDEKWKIIRDLQEKGECVAMVGDGINDAPSLTQADLGIAMSSGTEIAMEAADITLVSDNLKGVISAIELSRQTLRIVKQNLFWAFIYNSLGIPIAAGVLYPFTGTLLNPMFAALAMAMSSVSVVSNALRLKRFKPPVETSNYAGSE